jgi:hypothetical protein
MLFQNIELDAPSTHTGERRPWTPEEDHFLLEVMIILLAQLMLFVMFPFRAISL